MVVVNGVGVASAEVEVSAEGDEAVVGSENKNPMRTISTYVRPMQQTSGRWRGGKGTSIFRSLRWIRSLSRKR